MNETEQLQRQLNLMRGEPVVPLTGRAAIKQALSLRAQGLPYAAIATVMGIYHGEWYSRQRWYLECHKAGLVTCPGRRRTPREVTE
jgi:hypothetical protein